MSDTNDMRREFEVWCKQKNPRYQSTDDGITNRQDFEIWQAATKRATAVERERCAAQAEKATKNNRVIVASIDGVPTSACFIATAIRQGGAV